MVAFAAGGVSEDVSRLYLDKQFRRLVIQNSGWNIRKASIASDIPTEEVLAGAETAIKFGYFRARMYRFLTEKGEDPQLWLAVHRAAKPGRRRTSAQLDDFETVEQRFPEYTTYTLSSPLTHQEVMKAASEEMQGIFCAPGSDYHQAKLYTRHKFKSDRAPEYENKRAAAVHKMEGLSLTDCVELNELEESGRSPSVSNKAFLDSEDSPFGPVIITIARHFVKVFGLIPTLYWVIQKTMTLETPELLRCLATVGMTPKEFECSALRKDVDRKLRKMDEELANLSGDVTLRVAYETLGDE
jgi:hypothetical protein